MAVISRTLDISNICTTYTTENTDRNLPHPKDKRDGPHIEWENALKAHYGSYEPENKKKLWCPITKKWFSVVWECITAAHIVPHQIGFKNMEIMFGQPSKGFELMWSMDNGIIIDYRLEKMFDKAQVTLVGHKKPDGKPAEFTFVVLDDSVLEMDVHGVKVSGLDNTTLQFRNNERPGLKNVYWHFVTSLMRNHKLQREGFEQKILKLMDGRTWGNTGSWYDQSTLKYLAEHWGRTAQRFWGLKSRIWRECWLDCLLKTMQDWWPLRSLQS